MSQPVSPADVRSLKGLSRQTLEWLLRPAFVDGQAQYCEMVGRHYRMFDQPMSLALAECQLMEEDARRAQGGSIPDLLLATLISAHHNFAVALLQDEARGRMVQVSLDLAAYRQAHGKYPAALDNLPDPDRLPRDPFTATAAGGPADGKPFGYRLTPEGFMLWSIGQDGQDDGGQTADELKVDPDQGGDIVLRVPPLIPLGATK